MIQIKKKLNEKVNVREGFALGKSTEVVTKLANILTRLTKKKVTVSTMPLVYDTDKGRMLSYLGHYNTATLLRFNFLVTKNEQLAYIDVWAPNNFNKKPTSTISLEGYNIVQVVDQIADFLTGEFENYFLESRAYNSKRLRERVSVLDQTAEFLRKNPNIQKDLVGGKLSWDDGATQFLAFSNKEFGTTKSRLSGASFKWNVKTAIENNSDLQKVAPAAAVPSIAPTTPTVVKTTIPLDPKYEKLWKETFESGPAEAFDALEDYTAKIASFNPFINGLIAYGKPGTGKTTVVTDTLDKRGANYEVIRGSINGKENLLEVLYKFKQDTVIVFDDNDGVFNSQDMTNILKAALDSGKNRLLGIGNVLKLNHEFPNPDFDPAYDETEGVKETDPAFNGRYRRSIPPKFLFESKIIFLSNLSKIDPAILSRIASVEINFGKEDMLGYIKSKLSSLKDDYDEADMQDRLACFDLLVGISPRMQDVSFRDYINILGTYLSFKRDGNMTNWEKRAISFVVK